jgi:hypothetical protein
LVVLRNGGDARSEKHHEAPQCHGIAEGLGGVGIWGEPVAMAGRSDRLLDGFAQVIEGPCPPLCIWRAYTKCSHINVLSFSKVALVFSSSVFSVALLGVSNG